MDLKRRGASEVAGRPKPTPAWPLGQRVAIGSLKGKAAIRGRDPGSTSGSVGLVSGYIVVTIDLDYQKAAGWLPCGIWNQYYVIE